MSEEFNNLEFLASERLRYPELSETEKDIVANRHGELLRERLRKDAEDFVTRRVQPLKDFLKDAQDFQLDSSISRFGQTPVIAAPNQTQVLDTAVSLDRFCSLQSFRAPYSFGTNDLREFVRPARRLGNGESIFARTVEQGIATNGRLSVAAAIGNLSTHTFDASGNALFVVVTSASATIYQCIPIKGPGRVQIEVSTDLFNPALAAFLDRLQVVLLPDEARGTDGLAGARGFIDLDIITPSEVSAGGTRQVFLDAASLHINNGLGTGVPGSFYRQIEPLTTSVIVEAESTPNILVGISLHALSVLGSPVGTVNAYAGVDFRASSTNTVFPLTQGSPPGAIQIREIRAKTCLLDAADPTSTE